MIPKYVDDILYQGYDAALAPLLGNGLTWMPWVGRHYGKGPVRLLIVGESHYAAEKTDSPEVWKRKAENASGDPDFTRICIAEERILHWWHNKTFAGIQRTLVGQVTEAQEREFWGDVVFMNFIQRPMQTCVDRPTPQDFYSSWAPFVELVRVLKPTVCFFFGNTAMNFMNRAMTELEVNFGPVVCRDVAGCRIKEAWIKPEGEEVVFCAIRHPGRYYSWRKWRECLQQNQPAVMAFLQKQVAPLTST